MQLSERQQASPPPRRRGVRRAPASPWARRRSSSAPTSRVSPSTVRAELAELENARAADASAHVRGARADRARLPLLRRRAARTARAAAAGVPARPHIDEQRGRVGAAGDDRDALAGHAAARARLGAAARGDARAPRRGAAPAAAARDGRRHHVRRRGHEAALPLRRAGRRRGSRSGRAST